MTNEQISFLSNYKPQDEFFTSGAEVKQIRGIFGLLTMGAEQLQELRNEVVLFFRGLMGDDKWTVYEYMPSLQSVTAVIDDAKWRIGAEV